MCPTLPVTPPLPSPPQLSALRVFHAMLSDRSLRTQHALPKFQALLQLATRVVRGLMGRLCPTDTETVTAPATASATPPGSGQPEGSGQGGAEGSGGNDRPEYRLVGRNCTPLP